MESQKFRCRHCRKMRRRRTRDQRYCGEVPCQKARKNRWRREAYASDADYRANQADSSKAWLETQDGAAAYHRRYRRRRAAVAMAEPPADTETPPANSDADPGKSPVISGRYRLLACEGANSDAILVDLFVISER